MVPAMRALARKLFYRVAPRSVRALRWRFRRNADAILEHDRLHLGCGGEYWPGYVNVDVDPAANADLIMSFTDLPSVCAPSSISEVVMIHSLSYLRLWEAQELFEGLHLVMAQGGRVIIELPDVVKCAAAMTACPEPNDDYIEAIRGIYAFGVDQLINREEFVTYRFGWSGAHLKKELESAGFFDVKIMDPQTHGARTWRDVRIEATR